MSRGASLGYGLHELIKRKLMVVDCVAEEYVSDCVILRQLSQEKRPQEHEEECQR